MQFEGGTFSRGGLRCAMALLLAIAAPLCADVQDADLAKKLSNPIANSNRFPLTQPWHRSAQLVLMDSKEDGI